MGGVRDPIPDDRLELLGGHSSVRGHEQLEQSLRDLAIYTVELKEVVQELFLSIAGKANSGTS